MSGVRTRKVFVKLEMGTNEQATFVSTEHYAYLLQQMNYFNWNLHLKPIPNAYKHCVNGEMPTQQ